MALNSFLFLLLFLPVVAAGTYVLRDRVGGRSAQVWILLASLAFYAWAGATSFGLLLGSITFNWALGAALCRADIAQASRKRLLILALTVDIAVLCVFKYAGAAGGLVGDIIGTHVTIPDLGFPLGLSFFTLTQVMYLVDCYEGLVPANGWVDHATFVSFFPNVTAGPLLRAKRFFAQLGNLAAAQGRDERVTQAATLIALGLLKKVALGDSFSAVATAGYRSVEQLSTLEAWITTLAGTFEIYFDFSGYSDMAFGCAALLGLTLVRNFNSPYQSATISEFWKRWHISLSEFITTYLYTPILRSMGRPTLHKSALATLVAMLIAGIWHGASWNFVLFGVMHGTALAGFQYWKRRKRPLPRAVAVVLTFAFVNLAFITVRAPSVKTALSMAWNLLPHGNHIGMETLHAAIATSDLRMMAIPLVVGCIAAFAGPNAEQLATRRRPSILSDTMIITMLLVAYVFMDSRTVTEFRYRQF